MEPLSFLDAPETGASEPVAEAPVLETPPASEGPARGPDGKFAPREASPAPAEVPPEAAAPAAPTPELTPPAVEASVPPGSVPLAALLDTRDKVKALEAELQTLRAQKSAPRTGPTVNPDEDPRGAWEEGQALRRQTELDWSKRFAVKEHGEDVVNEAHQWAFARCDQDPTFNARIHASQDPYSLVLAEYRQHQLLETLQDPAKRDRLLALLSDEATPTASPQGQAPAAPAASPQPASVAPPVSSPLPPKSIASAPAAASAEVVPVGPGQAFDNAFR